MDDFGGNPTIFGNIHMFLVWVTSNVQDSLTFFNLTSPRGRLFSLVGFVFHPGLAESRSVFMSHDVVDLLSLRQVKWGFFSGTLEVWVEVKNETN